MTEFRYAPSQHLPFHDQEAIERCRRITREELPCHPNPDLDIQIHPDGDIDHLWVNDMFQRIWLAREEQRRIVLITPQPHPGYAWVADLINRLRVPCDHVWTFNMDEYANEHGEIAPETWSAAFHHSMKKHFYARIDPELRPPENQVIGPTTENIAHYGRMIEDLGGADICYSGPGWTGHLAFIEPDAPEFDAPLDEWKQMGPRVVTLSPFTLAQNSLHGHFGLSGDMAAVPPKAATIGPAQVLAAKNRIDLNALTVAGTDVAWQRIMTRLCIHGPVTPRLPTSILQTVPTTYWVSESIAQDIEPRYDRGY